MHLGEKSSRPLSTRKRRLVKAMAAVAVVLVLVSGWLHFAYREMPGIVVGSEFEISSGVDGTVARVHWREDERFRRGDELVTIESSALEAQLAAVEHDLEEIDRSLAVEQSAEGLERRRTDLQAEIAQSESELESARVELGSAERVLPGLREWRDRAAERVKRGEELLAQDALTMSELEERRQELLEAESKLGDATAKQEIQGARAAKLEQILGLYRTRLRNLVAERTAFVADLELRRQEKIGELDRLRARQADLHVIADHDGVVTAVLRQEGEYVASGGPILRAMRDGDVWVEAYLPVGDKGYVKPGDRVDVLGEIPVGSLRGRVSKVLPVLKPLPAGHQIQLGRQQNFAVVVITLEDGSLARTVLSPAQQVTARLRRRFGFGQDVAANAQGRDSR
jgi:multidrug resistance efflux pump